MICSGVYPFFDVKSSFYDILLGIVSGGQVRLAIPLHIGYNILVSLEKWDRKTSIKIRLD